jgi:predicted enzyme related to lactoylglutathione lyase
VASNPFVHVELQTKELDTAKKFYQNVFDWDLEDMPMGNGMYYTGIKVGEGTGGGMWTNPSDDSPAHWLPYVNVESIDSTVEKVRSMGGNVVQPKTEVPDMGWYSVIRDPSGAMLGLWQTKPGM